MRETQIIGLNSDAKTYIQNNCQEGEVLCPHCKQGKIKETLRVEYASAAHCGMFNDGPDLYEYTLKNGKKLKEVVQAVPWSSGPCIFLCLELDGSQLFLWTEKEINEA